MIKKMLLIFVMAAVPFAVSATEPAMAVPVYDLDQCIAIALERHPHIKASAGATRASESKVGQAKANYWPQLNVSAGYQRIGPASPPGASQDPYDQYTSGVNLGATLFDFGKTSTRIEIQNLHVSASRADEDHIKAQVILNVKNAYYNLLQSERNWNVALDTMKQFQQHLDQANAFFRTGVKPKFDVTKAEVDFGNARLNVMKAENTVRIARTTLKDAMGIPESGDFTIVDNLAFEKIDLRLDDLLAKAFAARPDLLALSAKTKAAESSIALARKGYYPTLSAGAGYGYSGNEFPLGRGWNAGATLNFPLFSGFATQYEVEEARANLDVIRANEESLRRQIRLDVEQAYLNVQDTAEQISMAELTVLQAKENFDLASGRYSAGVGNPIEVADATITLNNARANLNTSLYNYKMAQASLEKSIGVTP